MFVKVVVEVHFDSDSITKRQYSRALLNTVRDFVYPYEEGMLPANIVCRGSRNRKVTYKVTSEAVDDDFDKLVLLS